MALGSRAYGLPLTLASVGVVLQVTAGYWDVYSHRVFFLEGDSPWNPAHFALYAGGFLLVAGILLWWRRQREGLRRLPGYAWIVAGAILQVGAAISNEAWHAFLGADPPLAPPHIVAVVGMIVAAFGVLSALVAWRTYGAPGEWEAGRWLWGVDVLLILSFTAMWMAAIGSVLFVGAVDPTGGRLYPTALLISGLATVIVVAALRTFRGFGPLTLIGLALAAVNWIFLVGYVGIEAYAPLSLLPFLLVDLLHRFGASRLSPWAMALIAGGLLGFLHNLTFFPFLLGVAWPHAPDLGLLGVTLAGAAGGLLAHGVFEKTGARMRESGDRHPAAAESPSSAGSDPQPGTTHR